MGIFSRFENKVEDTLEGAANKMFDAPISPVQIAKKCEKQMRRETMVGAGKQYAPTLYTVLVNPDDDERLFGYYPTLAGETETYLSAKAAENGLVMDGQPLVRFVVDDGLRHGKFDVIAEAVAAPIVAQLRQDELVRYGIVAPPAAGVASALRAPQAATPAAGPAAAPVPHQRDGYADTAYAPDQVHAGYAQQNSQNLNDPALAGYAERAGAAARKPPLPYVPEDQIDYSIDYGEYTFESRDFEDYRSQAELDRRNRSMAEARAAHPDANAPGAHPIAVGGAASAGAAAAGAAAQAAGHAAQAGRMAAPAPAPAIPTVPRGTYARPRSNSLPLAGASRARVIDCAYQRTYDLAGAHITLGRDTGNDIVVQDTSASRRHAELRLSPQGYWSITDMGSTNGTTVNGSSVTVQALQNGDTFTIGKTNFQFIVG
ncbi:DUF3662 and FHA domain-containing protein [Berryella wangjianweii]|uniref:DUF3662 and FHA domain-containing protein n=1 Tax=Berryella wangjianweii TaxID=2734634 RepID=A0A6M8J1X0_9ACTN|nr:DUF3662 and FHA domain-containing protein [Berryella wangjianweii]QKF07564.1 DUF3662 and FHA domain-containing protein [Berryella wangjianweii]